ncbi:hypothetical protein OIU34_23210 [Pararhizobium sp. BT-229]|uniref:hypothetical protein n=1 Tax=Pararhizobium sp. BT-229 TaxID=2986923 RepID=UPI0021F76468|nr:hypothetical protein [Pararhizobium sp. BT-229]MCV9964805.1 hypothetical protein [Pararhizobium sp. BT-229]
MNAELLIHYDIHAMPGGTRRYAETVALDIREPSEEEAPIAIEWDYGATRWFEGVHYRRVDKVFEEGLTAAERGAALSSYLNADGATSYSNTRSYADTKPLSSDRKFSERRHPDVANDFRRLKAIEKAEALARDCIVVDGAIWLRCGEPRLVYHPATRAFAASIQIETTDWTVGKGRYRFGKDVQRPSLEIAAYSTRLDSIDNLQQVMAQWAIIPDAPAFTLHIPESINRDEFPAMLREAVEGLVSAKQDGQLSRMSGDLVLHVIFDVGEYLDETADEEIDHEYLAATLERVRLLLPGADRKKKALLSTVVRRWEDRPIDVDLSVRQTSVPRRL